MKKIILLLAIMLMASPAMATVTITVTDDGGSWARIDYSHDEGANFIRAFALDVNTNGALITEIDSNHPAYWVYPGTIDINDAGGVNDVGSPVAPDSYPGTLGGLGTTGVTIEMGALFEGGVDPDPASSGTLLRVKVDGDCRICVNGNSIRGNVVMKDATSNDPTEACADITGGCACLGDVNGSTSVNFSDLIAIYSEMVSQYPTGDPTYVYEIGNPPGLPCGDVNFSGSINFSDLIAIYSEMVTQYPTGDPTYTYEIGCPF